MSDSPASPVPDVPDPFGEIVRLNKIIQALINRAERGASVQSSDFNLFQTTVLLEEQVRARTAELEAALRENERTNRALRDSEAKFHGVVNQSLAGIGIIESERFNYVNPRLAEMFGYDVDEGVTLDPLAVVVESDRAFVAQNIRERLNGGEPRSYYHFRGVRKDGEIINVEVWGNRMDISGKPAVLAMMMDITERVRIEAELRSLQDRLREESTHDALTGLYNRRYFEEGLERELSLAHRERHPVSVIMGDLDHFKSVNDHHGHLAGDEVLRVFADIMRRSARASDLCCRYGGEEFLLVLPRMSRDDAAARAEQLRVAMSTTPVIHGLHRISVTASFGVATFPDDGRTSDELIVAADDALYAAKEAGRNSVRTS